MAATAKPLIPQFDLPAGATQISVVVNENAVRAEVMALPALSLEASQPGAPPERGLYILSAAWGDEVAGTLAYYRSGAWTYWTPFLGLEKTVGTDRYVYAAGAPDAWELAGGPVGTAWGGITGTLADQTDLQAALDALQTGIDGKLSLVEALGAPVFASGTLTVNCGSKSKSSHSHTLTANVTTLAFSNLAGSGNITEFDLLLAQDATGSRTFALPASFKKIGDSDTAIPSAANAKCLLSAKTFDNGTTWNYVLQDIAA